MWTKPTTSSPDPFAPPPASGPLFPASLISPAVSSALPETYTIRPLQRSDFNAGHLDPLRVLTQVGEISQQEWVRQYDWMARIPDTYYLLVICDGNGKIVGTGTLMKERKLSVYPNLWHTTSFCLRQLFADWCFSLFQYS